jgi:phage/plasmid-associated DNA primase
MRPTIMRGSIFSVGEGHNGKSVLLGLATSMVGERNTTQVSGNDLGKWDYLVDLQTTWFNCPSETELAFLKENTGAFKTLSAHETFAIRKKHGDASVPVKGAFPIVFNINKLPELGDDAPAILSRMFINNFDVDFEAEGKAVKDYARKTFLEDKNTMPTLTGMVLAFAHYYSQPEHMWKESPSMKAELAALTDIATPQKRYVEWFKMFFDGYAGITLLKADYINFGKQEGEEYDTGKMTQSSLLFKQFKRRSQSNGTFYVLSETTYPVKRFTVSKNLYIRKYMGTMTWEEFQNDGNSLVHKMMLEYLSREEEYRKHLKLYLETKTDEEIKKKVLQDMWKEIIDEQRGAPYERQ